MQQFSGKGAFVTGGASGIGLALGRALASAGAREMLADIEQGALDTAAAELRAGGADVRSVVCDVADAASVQRAAAATFDAFGAVHVLCNNAGVGGGSGVDDISLETWRWVIDVNLMGVVHGIAAFLPHMLAHGQGGHIVNTASLAGLQANIGFSPYVASKYGVVGISEGLEVELRERGVGVSVLCPGFVRTQIAASARNRPERYGAARTPAPGSARAALAVHLAERAAAGLDPDAVAARVLDAVRRGELYVFTHPEMRGEVDERLAAIRSALDRTTP